MLRFLHTRRDVEEAAVLPGMRQLLDRDDELLATEGELIEPCGARARDVRELSIERSERRALLGRAREAARRTGGCAHVPDRRSQVVIKVWRWSVSWHRAARAGSISLTRARQRQPQPAFEG